MGNGVSGDQGNLPSYGKRDVGATFDRKQHDWSEQTRAQEVDMLSVRPNSYIIIIINIIIVSSSIVTFVIMTAYTLFAMQFLHASLSEVEGCYTVPHVSAHGYTCRTNLPRFSLMRGAGLPQAILITEHWIRAVADYLNVPAAKVSKK